MFRLSPTMNSHFFPPSCFNRLVYLLEAYSVLCEVRTKFLYIVTSFSPRRLGFDPRPVYVRFVFAKLALGQVFPRVFTSVFPYHCHSTSFIHMLLLLGKMDEAWEHFKRQFSFESRGAFDRNVISFFFFSRWNTFLEVSMHPEGPENGQIDRCIPWFFSALDHMLSS